MPSTRSYTPKLRSAERLAALRFDAIAEMHNLLIIALDKRGRIKLFSKGCEELTGYTEEELVRKSFIARMIPLEHQKACRQELRAFIASDTIRKFVCEVTTKMGERRIIEWKQARITYEEGALREIICIGQDVTEEEYVEEAYKAIVERTPQGLIIIQEDRIVFVNSVAAEHSGYSVEEVLAKSPVEVLEMLHPEDREDYLRRLQERLAGKPSPVSVEYRFLRRDGTVIWIQGFPSIVSYHGKPATQVALIDITEKKEAEQALRESETFTSTILEHSPNPILVVNPDTSIRYVNAAFEELSGFTAADIVGGKPPFPWWQMDPDVDMVQAFTAVMEVGFSGRESEVRTKSGDIRRVQITSTPVMIEDELVFYISTWVDVTSQRRAEAARATSERLYRAVVDGSLLGVTIRQGDRFVFANSAAAESYGRSVEELLSLTPEEMLATVLPEDQEAAIQRHKDRLAGKPLPERYEYRLIRKDGTFRWLEVYSTQIEYEGTPATQFHSVDITERKQAEEAYQLILDHSPFGIMILQERTFVFVNNRFVEMIGYSADKLLAMTAEETWETVHSEDREEAFGHAQRTLEGEPVPPSITFRFFRKDGTIRWVEVSSVRIEFMGKPALQVTLVDITEQKQTEEALHESEAQYQGLFDRIPVGLYRSMPDGQIVDANPAMAQLLAYPNQESLQKVNATELYVDQADRQQWQRLMEEKGVVRDFLVQMRCFDGRVVWVNNTAQVFLDKEGEALFYEGIIQDITQRRQTEIALQESEEKYRSLFENMSQGFAFHKVVVDEDGQPIDYIFLEINKAFEEQTGLKREDVIGKRVTELLAGIEDYPADLIGVYGDVALTGKPAYFEQFAAPLDRWYTVSAYCPRPGYFVSVFYEISEQKRAQQALLESEDKYRTLVEQSLLGIIILQANPLRISFVNEAAAQLIGRSVDEAPSMSPQEIQELIHIEERRDTFERLTSRLRGEDVPPRWELRLIHKDRSAIWVDIASQIIEFKGEPAVQVTLVDISERKEAEELIRIQRDLGLALSATSDLHTVLKLCLEATIEVSGMDSGGVYLVNEVTGDLELLIHKGLSPSFVKNVGYYEAGSPNNQLVMKGDPVYLNYEEFPVPSEQIDRSEGLKVLAMIPVSHENRVIACLNVASHTKDVISAHGRTALEMIATQIGTAITRARIGQALRENEKTYRTLFETMAQGVVYQNASGEITSANPAAERILGLSLDQMQGRTSVDPQWRSIKEDGSDFPGESHPAMVALKTGEEVHDVIMGVYNPAEDITRWIRIGAVPQFRTGDEQPYQVYTTFYDITELKLAQEALQESERKYRSFVENFPGIAYRADINGAPLFFQGAAEAITGYTEDDFVSGRVNWMQMIHPDDWGQIEVGWKEMGTVPGASTRREYRIIHREGHIRWMHERIRNISDETGIVTQVEGVLLDITERKQIDTALRRERDRAQQYLDVAGVILVALDTQEEIILINRKGCELLGVYEEEAMGKNWFDNFLPERFHKDVKQVYAQLKGEVDPVEYHENPILTSKGEERLIAWHTVIFRDEEGNILGSLSSGEDITERRQMEQALLDSEERLRSVTENSPDQIILLDQKFRILFINRILVNLTMREVLGKSILDFISPDFQQTASDCYKRVWVTGKPETFYSENQQEDGTVQVFEVRVSPILESGRAVALVSNSTDITDRRETEEQLRESEAKYRSFVENFLGIAYRSQPDYSIEFFHGAVQSITGYTEEDFVSGRIKWDQVIYPDDWARLQKDFDRMGKVPGAIGELEYRIIRKDGTIRWLHDNMRGLYNPDYQVTAIEGVLIDITERKEAEEVAFESRARAEFFNDLMVHDLTNIHQAILSLLELVLLESNLPIQVREFVQTALAQLVRSSDLISKVKKFALIDTAPLKRAQSDISEPLFAAADAIRDSYPQRKLNIHTPISPGKYYAQVDEFLYDMFFNLLHNAMRYDRREEVHVDVLVEEEEEFLKIQIQDWGPGISDGDKEQIFARLSSKERGERGVRGRGIGLTLVQRIVTRYRGRIWVEDRVPGDHTQGASFVVLLPRGDTE